MTDKRPSFQFYPADFLSDYNVMSMSMEERGAYITLICICWMQGHIPSDPDRVRQCLSNPTFSLELIMSCFKQDPENERQLYHPRLSKERDKQDANRKRAQDAGKKGGLKRVENARLSKGGLDSAQANRKQIQPSSSVSTSSLKDKTLKESEGKPPTKKNKVKKMTDEEITETVRVERKWIAEFKEKYNCEPNMSLAKDRTILKFLIKSHGVEEVERRAIAHIHDGKLLSIVGFRARFNDLTQSNSGGKVKMEIGINGDKFDPQTETDPALLEGDRYK